MSTVRVCVCVSVCVCFHVFASLYIHPFIRVCVRNLHRARNFVPLGCAIEGDSHHRIGRLGEGDGIEVVTQICTFALGDGTPMVNLRVHPLYCQYLPMIPEMHLVNSHLFKLEML